MEAETLDLHKVRYESFGGIISSINPPFLAWVDKDYMKSLGYSKSPRWSSGDTKQYLSAPTEVHFAITNKCNRQCAGCYMGSGQTDTGALSVEEIKSTIKKLAEMGVFHIAFGGGEAFTLDRFDEIVTYCREQGVVPNLTTNGQNIGDKEIAICKQMGQVNISMDGIGSRYGINGRDGSFAAADAALKKLMKAGVSAGINCVVSRKNFHYLRELLIYARSIEVHEIEFLKYKPSGRGVHAYDEYALTQKMIRCFYPMVEAYADDFSMELKVDCSFIPAIVYHKPSKEDLEKLGVVGCDGGNLLLAVTSNGSFSGCSFVNNNEPVSELTDRWDSSVHLNKFRSLVDNAEEPCRSCEYLTLCRCGCRAVALHRYNDFFKPDPECPIVYDT